MHHKLNTRPAEIVHEGVRAVTAEQDQPTTGASEGSLLALALLAVLVGAIAGLLGALFRLALDRANDWRNQLLHAVADWELLGLGLVVVLTAAAAALAAALVRWYAPQAKGSGIPHVEAVLAGRVPAAPLMLLPVKVVGGVLAIGVGLALGREGPSVQLGANTSHLLGGLFRRNAADCRTLLAAGAGAGLATAFSVPIAGAVFVLEELVRRFDTRITIATLAASASAIAVAQWFLGARPDLDVPEIALPHLVITPLFALLGVVMGLLGVVYNRAMIATEEFAEQRLPLPVEARAALVGAGVGLAAWWLPQLIGGGETLTLHLLKDGDTVAALIFGFLFRFVLGAVSYAAGTPGGLFAPLLALGAQGGLLYGLLCQRLLGGLAPSPTAFAIVGMAALFTAAVRAPVTGIVLLAEMTGSFNLLLPMLAGCWTAMTVPTLCGCPPIYDLLRVGSPKARD
ncbi:MAG: H(+)/Cl(-) exchange transporter ClcA [Planctomycetia bacterium]|nr:H(+)/Cl(-) exchange transporter ClcA [Planctomycetia bacterium]